MPTIPEITPYTIANNVAPQAADLERSILGSALIEKEAMYTMLEKLGEKDFYNPSNAEIFSAIKALFEDNRDPEEEQIALWLEDHGSLESVGGRAYINELSLYVSSATYTEDYCDIIIEKRKRRDCITGFRKVLSMANDQSVDFNELMSSADNIIFDLVNDQGGSGMDEAKDYITKAYEEIINVQGAADGITGIASGTDVDKRTAGWQSTEFIVIAARPSMGKTAFVLKALTSAASVHGAAGLISLEMSSDGLGKRLLVSEAGIDGQRTRRGMLYEDEIKKLGNAAERLQSLGLVIDDTTFVDPARLRAKARAMIHKYDIKVLAIDYVQLLTSDKDNREQQVAEVSRTCKAIAKEYKIPVIGLSQLNRNCESRRGWDKRPQLGDLRESGAIEQDADMVCFLFRPEYYGLKEYPETISGRWAGKGTQNVCEFIIGKNRNGPTGMTRLGFEKEHARFFNLQAEPRNDMRDAFDKAAAQKAKYDKFNEHSPF